MTPEGVMVMALGELDAWVGCQRAGDRNSRKEKRLNKPPRGEPHFNRLVNAVSRRACDVSHPVPISNVCFIAFRP